MIWTTHDKDGENKTRYYYETNNVFGYVYILIKEIDTANLEDIGVIIACVRHTTYQCVQSHHKVLDTELNCSGTCLEINHEWSEVQQSLICQFSAEGRTS